MANADDFSRGFTLFDISTGAIRIQVGSYLTARENRQPGEGILTGRWDDGLWYVRDGQPTERPKLFPEDVVSLVADGLDTLVVAMPNGTQVRIDRGNPETIEDGSFEFVTAFPGETQVEVFPPFPYQQQTVRIIADAH